MPSFSTSLGVRMCDLDRWTRSLAVVSLALVVALGGCSEDAVEAVPDGDAGAADVDVSEVTGDIDVTGPADGVDGEIPGDTQSDGDGSPEIGEVVGGDAPDADIADDGDGTAGLDGDGETATDADGSEDDTDLGEGDVDGGGDGDADPDAEIASELCTSDEDCLPEGACMLGACDLETGECSETQLPEGSVCEDGNACSIGDKCTAEGWCMGLQAINCDDQNPCTDDTCDPAIGCVPKNNFAACDDGDPCTSGEQCGGGSCTGSVPLCEDGNPCTVDTCDADTATCENTPDDELQCTDESACTQGDACISGSCVPGPVDGCDDGNPCTENTCEDGTICVTSILDGAACDDGDACTAGDTCDSEACTSGPAADCEDENACTQTECDSATGCTTLVLEFDMCDDGDACSIMSQCDGIGACVTTVALECDDLNGCTDDSCEGATGCVFAPTSEPCDDEDACTIGDTCAGGECLGQAADCDDLSACTIDSCDTATGCAYEDVTPTCVSENPCEDAACHPAVGCTTVSNTDPCDDENACTQSDICGSGGCEGEAIVCEDDDICTQDSCDVAEGCQHEAVDIPCDDGDECTVDEACEALDPFCNGGTALDIDDGVDCTVDACDPVTGAAHDPDAYGCQVGEACDAAAGCQAGAAALVISKYNFRPTDPVVDGQGQWLAITNVGTTLVDLSAYFVGNESGAISLIKGPNGVFGDPILIGPGETLAGLKTPVADPPIAPEPFGFLFGNAVDSFGWDVTEDDIVLRDQNNAIIDKLTVKSVSLGPISGADESPAALGVATELDREALAAATSKNDNDDALQWCAYDADGSDPGGQNIDCQRARLNEISVAGADGERFVEIHLPYGGHTGELEIRLLDAGGVTLSTIPVSGLRTPVGEALVFTDGVDGVALGLATDGSVSLTRDGVLLDVYGFGTLSAEVSADGGHVLVEGAIGPPQVVGESAARIAPGVDTDDNAADFATVASTPGAF
jgi:hypothetical protein